MKFNKFFAIFTGLFLAVFLMGAATLDNTFQIGGASAGDRFIRFRIGSSTFACFKWDNAASKLKYSVDCSTFKTFNLGTDIDSTGGSAGEVATADGSGGTTWETPVTAGADSVLTKTGDYTILTGDFSATKKLMLKCNCATACTQTLPAASNTGFEVTVSSVGAGVCSLARAGSDTINGATTLAIGPQYSAQTVQADGGTAWHAKSASDGGLKDGFAATGADSTATVGNYTNYIFTSTGTRTLTVTRGGYCKFLLVGGGGGASHGGGGGGGVIDHYFADIYLKPGAYTINVGTGGSGTSASADVRGGTGGDTTAFGFTAKGGGGGGAYGATQANGGAGGSGGGGGGGGGSGAGSGGAATFDKPEVQGYAGAASPGATGGCYTSSGGGGAGQVGAVGSACTGGNGGNGTRSMIKGTVGGDYFGGGGGGGQGNSGGSCAGSAGTGGTGGGGSGGGGNGGANTGGGGAGGCSATGTSGGNGGSGIAIISCQTSF